MVNIGDYTGGSSGQHLMDDYKPRHLGAKEAETRLGATSMRFQPCLVTGNSRRGFLNGLNENGSIRGRKKKQGDVIRSKRNIVMGSDTNGNGLVKEAPRQGKAFSMASLAITRANDLLHGK
jgi:hypothetical protein